MYSTPAYISSNPTDACDFSSTSGHPAGSCDPPADVCADGTGTDATFTNFVTALAQHMNNDSLPKIHYWEIWNEPNDVTFWNGTSPVGADGSGCPLRYRGNQLQLSHSLSRDRNRSHLTDANAPTGDYSG